MASSAARWIAVATLFLLCASDARAQLRVGWSDDASDWNAGLRTIGSVDRLPVTGLSALGSERAVILVPHAVDWSRPVTLLIHLHGYTAGYLQTAAGYADTSLDAIPQQLARFGGNVVAVLPQGTPQSGFAPGAVRDTGCAIDDLAAEVVAALEALGQSDGRAHIDAVVLSGHSGGGNPIIEGLAADAEIVPRTVRLAGILLFDGVNRAHRVRLLTDWILRRLDRQIAAVRSGRAEARRVGWLDRQPRIFVAWVPNSGYGRRGLAVERAVDRRFERSGLTRRHATALRALYRFAPAIGTDRHLRVVGGHMLEAGLAHVLRR